ncbi:MAG: replication-associated recombination protein A [Firmicutes bacterium]|jgi:putative ATPase|nr:replication-associated recombination protein A [Bacillota bacterium]
MTTEGTLFAALHKKTAPLAERMRPQTLAEFVGQEQALGTDTPLRAALDNGHLVSLILWGPPGCGKTTLARLVAKDVRAYFYPLSAVAAGVSEVRQAVREAKDRLQTFCQRTVLFLDEIHRFNRVQQDALLPYVEEGLLILLGATTENPYYNLTAPLLSRCQVVSLKPLKKEDITIILERALSDKERGLGNLGLTLTQEGIDTIWQLSSGDARAALNILEQAALSSVKGSTITRELILQVGGKILPYDGAGDYHYDTISAYIKSLRGSDPDAALYWLARMLKAGEDPRFIARRLVIAAAEDVGNADPQALQVAVAAAQALEMLGLPEGQIPLAQATIYVATAPKSNACYVALHKAMADVDTLMIEPVPLHLRNAAFQGAKKLGIGQDYKYPHDYDNNFVQQEYRPQGVANRAYYLPTDNGTEQEIKARLQRWWGKRKS